MLIFDHILESAKIAFNHVRVLLSDLQCKDLVDAIRDADSSKDWQAMKDAIAGWNLTCTDTNGETKTVGSRSLEI